MDTTTNGTEMTVEVKARVPKPMKRQVKALAKQRMQSTSDIVRAALCEFLRRAENGGRSA